MQYVFRERASVVCVKDQQLLTVRLEDPFLSMQRLYLPGGGIEIEQRESPEQAAFRETLEETGWHVDVDRGSAQVLEYDFFWNGIHIPCRTHFFLAQLNESKPQQAVADNSLYYIGWEWLPLTRLDEEFAYHPRILQLIKDILNKSAS